MKNIYVPKFCDANSILLVNQSGVLKKLYCPFRVNCVLAVQDFKLGTSLWVDEVATNSKDALIYWILGKPYLHIHFEIKASF